MTKIGYEFEVLCKLHDDELLNDLGDEYDVTVDPSIKFDEDHLKRDGWHRWEIITKPQPKRKALQTLAEIQRYLAEIDAHTNNSCGFHVNVSSTNMSKFDPVTLVAITDEFLIGNTFDRTNNSWCIPWSKYFDSMWRSIKRKEKINPAKVMMDNGTALIESSAFGSPPATPYAKRVGANLVDKYVSVNVSKMIYGYVEFRMIGGRNYHQKMLEPFVRNFADNVEAAAKGRDRKVIKTYFSQYN
jgi:hypothetical protein